MTIKIKGSRPVSCGAFIRALQRAKENPLAIFDRSFLKKKPTTGREILNEYINAVHTRITAGIPMSNL
jgi:hypothetical protein